MPTYTSKLLDFGLDSLDPLDVEIIFEPSGSAVTDDNSLLVARPIVAKPLADGSFSVDLAATETLQPLTFYGMTFRWREPEDAYQRGHAGYDFPTFRLVTAEGGGDLTKWLHVPFNNFAMVIAMPRDPEPGDNWPVGAIWLNTTTGEYARRLA